MRVYLKTSGPDALITSLVNSAPVKRTPSLAMQQNAIPSQIELSGFSEHLFLLDYDLFFGYNQNLLVECNQYIRTDA
jgi:hypothetical protein